MLAPSRSAVRSSCREERSVMEAGEIGPARFAESISGCRKERRRRGEAIPRWRWHSLRQSRLAGAARQWRTSCSSPRVLIWIVQLSGDLSKESKRLAVEARYRLVEQRPEAAGRLSVGCNGKGLVAEVGFREMLLVTHWAPGKQIIGGALRPRGSSFEQSDELAEVIEIVAREQCRFVDVGSRHVGAEMPDHGRAEGRPDVLSACRFGDFARSHVTLLERKHRSILDRQIRE